MLSDEAIKLLQDFNLNLGIKLYFVTVLGVNIIHFYGKII
jgi:hypothetical protein